MDLKCAVCFLTLAVGISAYSSSSDASPDNLAGSCVGSCLEDQSDPQLMLVQRQANRMTEGKAFEKVEDQSFYTPVTAHDVPVACSAHSACAGLTGDCCPSMGGSFLACCDKPDPTPPACSAHSGCAGLQGDCCPTATGVQLACCDKEEEEETESETETETESPTETPTPDPTETPPPEGTSYATGDPHVTNIRGEKFNVFKNGQMEFLRVPFQAAHKDANLTLLGVVQDVVGTSDECEQQRYITSVLFGGAWIGDHKLNVSIVDGELVARLGHGASFTRVNPSNHETPLGDLHLLHLHMRDKEQLQLRAGEMAIGVSAAGSHAGKPFFLNLEAKSVAALKSRIGGLLGEDSHDDVSTRPMGCLPKLMKHDDAISFATAE